MRPFQAFLDDHAETMWRVCVATVGRQEAEDAFQEACLAALRAWDRERIRDERAFAVMLAHRRAIDAGRARTRRAAVPLDGVPEPAAPPSRRPVDHDDELWLAVRALPDAQRAAVTLRFAADLRPAEVASALSISPEAARRRLSDGLATLRRSHPS